MLDGLGFILSWLRGGSLKLLSLAGIILLVWGTVSPVGTLVWWVKEGAQTLGLTQDQAQQSFPDSNSQLPSASSQAVSCYIIFLTGVGDFSTNQLTAGEEYFLDQLEQEHRHCVTVRDVFPYSAANESLGDKRLLAPIWRFAHQADGWLAGADVLIKIRNLWRFALSADDRYGPVYNQGIAIAMLDRMNETYPIRQVADRPLNLILIGTSGGAQVSMGASDYLRRWLPAKITMISVGGVFSGINGFAAVEQVYHLQGEQDWIDDIGNVVFPSRWPWTIGSPFNQAQRQGRYHVVSIGPQGHDGPEGYFGQAIAPSSEIAYVDLTLQAINQLPIWSP